MTAPRPDGRPAPLAPPARPPQIPAPAPWHGAVPPGAVPPQYAPSQQYAPPQYPPQQYAPPAPVAVPVASGVQMKRRHPVAAWLGLPLLTLGIYHYVWYYKIHREMADFDRRRQVPTVGPVLVLLLLGWTLVAPLVSIYNTGGRIRETQRAAGLQPSCSGGIGLLLMFVFGLGTLYYQSELNRVIESYGAPAGAPVPLYA